jgi:hypothetical protein
MNNSVRLVLTLPGWSDAEESDYKWHKELNTGTALKFYYFIKTIKWER